MTDITVGDKVTFKEFSTLGAGLKRPGQVGSVIAVYDDLPGQAGPRVDIEFADGGLERRISVHQLARRIDAFPRDRIDLINQLTGAEGNAPPEHNRDQWCP